MEKNKNESRPRLFVDMDGTLAVFNKLSTLETLYEENYFRSLAPIPETLEAIKRICADGNAEVFILSAYLSDSKYALSEKQAWLDEHLPQINAEHRLFLPCGENKAQVVPDGVAKRDYLLDDYTKNLNEWESSGGTGIKLLNGINNTHGTWQGVKIDRKYGGGRIAEAIQTVVSQLSIDNNLSESLDFDIDIDEYGVLVKYKGNGGDVVIPDSVEVIDDWAFNGCKGLTSVTIPNSVTSIDDWAFNGCTGLKSVTIPDSVEVIGDWAFLNCTGLTSITIPKSVTSIGGGAFAECTGLTSITVDGNNTKYSSIDGVLYNKDKTKLITYPAGKTDTSFTMPSSVTRIGVYAFSNCTGLTSVTIPNSVKVIDDCAFLNCTGLTSVTIPNSVTSIDDWAFNGCARLTEVKIPDSVKRIGEWAFCGCTGLTSITIPDSVTSIGSYAFDGCTGLETVTLTGVAANPYGDFGKAKVVFVPNENEISQADNAIEASLEADDELEDDYEFEM